MLQESASFKFSDVLKHNTDLLKLSPTGHAFAVAVHRRLNIWNTHTLEINQRFMCMHSIDSLEWSPNSELIICVSTKKNIVQVLYLCDDLWQCKVDVGSLGIADVKWAPDSRHILIVSTFNIRLSIWSLVSRSVTHVQNLKSIKSAICFTPCSKYLILVERKDFKDFIAVYTCDTWQPLKEFCIETKNLSEIQISPKGSVVTAVENNSEGFKVLFYSIDGRQLGNYTCDAEFGVKTLTWSSTGFFVAASDCYEKVQILDGRNFKLILSYEHPEVIESKDIKVYKIGNKPVQSDNASIFFSNREQYELIKTRPVFLPSNLPKAEDTKIKNPVNYGVQILKFSSDGYYIASINGNMPKVVWIFSMQDLAFSSVLIQSHNVKSISWHPDKPFLAICTGTPCLYIWSPSACFTINLPTEDSFYVNNATWCPGKSTAILTGKGCSLVLQMP